MTKRDPLAALEAIGQTNALLTYEIGQLTNGSRLSQIKPELDRLQHALSRVNAMLTMDPDVRVTFETMSAEDVAELRNLTLELERITTPRREPINVNIIAEPKDGRRVSQEICDRISGCFIAYPSGGGYSIDVSHHLYSRLGHLDPYDEGFEYLDADPVYDDGAQWLSVPDHVE